MKIFINGTKKYIAERNHFHMSYFNLSSFIYFKNGYMHNAGTYIHGQIYLKKFFML